MRILVTGGGGFLGRAIVERLVARGDEVTSVARGDYPELRAMGVRTERGDLADAAVAARAVEGQDAIIHAAAKAGVWGPPEEYRRSNVEATERLLDAARAAGVRRFVFTSSPSVTFDGTDAVNAGPDLPYPERFLSTYAQTKAEAEQIVLASASSDFLVTSLRPHLIYGPRDTHLIPRVLARHRAGKLRRVGKGDNVVDITYVDNAAVAHLQALDALEQEDGPAGKAYFISDDHPVKIWDWLDALFRRVGLPQLNKSVSAPLAYFAGAMLEGTHLAFGIASEPRMTRFVAQQLATSHYYDMGPARRDFGYTPVVDPETALDRTIEGLRARGLC